MHFLHLSFTLLCTRTSPLQTPLQIIVARWYRFNIIRFKRSWSCYGPLFGLTTTNGNQGDGYVAYKFFQNWLRVPRLRRTPHMLLDGFGQHYWTNIFTKNLKWKTPSQNIKIHGWTPALFCTPNFLMCCFFFSQWWRKTPRSARKYCNTGATAQEREQALRWILGFGSNITVNLICYRVTSTRD